MSPCPTNDSLTQRAKTPWAECAGEVGCPHTTRVARSSILPRGVIFQNAVCSRAALFPDSPPSPLLPHFHLLFSFVPVLVTGHHHWIRKIPEGKISALTSFLNPSDSQRRLFGTLRTRVFKEWGGSLQMGTKRKDKRDMEYRALSFAART